MAADNALDKRRTLPPWRENITSPIDPHGIINILTDHGSRDGFTYDAALRPDTKVVLEMTLSRSWDLFTHLDEGYMTSLTEPISLLYDACWDPDGDGASTMNCSKICGNKETLFKSWQTLWNCLTLASLSLAGTTFPSLNDSSSALIEDALFTMSITNATQFDGMRVLNDTYECAAASCRDQSMGDCTIVRPDSDYAQDGGVRWIEMYHSLSKICDNLESELSPDIAGPGVLISYITQTAMALYVWLFVLLLQTKNIIDPLKSTIDTLLGKRCGTAILRPRQPSIIHRLEQTNVAHATSTFLADLHEAQCFFVIAIAIALLYAGSQSAVFTGADNWQSLLRNHNSVNVLAGMGTWPIILTQMSLRRADLDSIYYLILSTVTLVLAAVASDTAIRPEADKVYRMFKDLNNQLACGGNPSLRTFCVDTDYDPYFGPLGSTTIYVYLGLLGLLWWVRFWEWLSATERFQLKFNRLSKTSNIICVQTVYTLSKMARILMFAAEFSAILIMGFGVASVHSALAGTLHQSDSGSWSVGQVIALMIWAPLLSKYLHLIILGTEKGFSYRLSRGFMIVKRAATDLRKNDEKTVRDT